MNNINILGIESSCDDTSVAIVQNGKVLSNQLYSQWIHSQYGGVVPEVASRLHVESIIDLTDAALQEAGLSKKDLKAVAVTRGPGLVGSLLVGISFAKSLHVSLDIPLIEVNHLQAHLNSLWIDDKLKFPLLCLTVSGGHTQLLLVQSMDHLTVLGQTLDDAVGEAFDKTGKLLGLPYPSGPVMDKLANQGIPSFNFPIAKVPGYNFSFSGLKTSVLYFLRDSLKNDPDFIKDNLNNLCASIQTNLVAALIQKVTIALQHYDIKSIGICGGVAANSGLRNAISELSREYSLNLIIPKMEYCTDNAAMIAITGYHKFLKQEFISDDFIPLARYPIT
jgi:N6-L-threonylcarbamoyladenine synthase